MHEVEEEVSLGGGGLTHLPCMQGKKSPLPWEDDPHMKCGTIWHMLCIQSERNHELHLTKHYRNMMIYMKDLFIKVRFKNVTLIFA